MDVRRVREWEWLTGLAGLVLLLSLFLPWYGSSGSTANAWQSFAVTDVILALAALGAIALPILAATQRTAAVPQAWASSLIWVVLAAAVLAVIRVVHPPAGGVTREAGVWIGAVAVLALVAFDIKSMRDKRFPSVMRPRLDIETIAAPTADGTRRDAP
jgi:hypothetical protein